MTTSPEIRNAKVEDAVAICEVLRRSITECCVADHNNNPDTISAWLANKTPDNIAQWIQSSNAVAVVATHRDGLIGFALGSGEALTLCYVVPEVLHQGVGKRLLATVESRTVARGISVLRLESTRTASPFYLRNGFLPSGPVQHWAGMESQPMTKQLMTNPILRPMNEVEYADWAAASIPLYAAENVRSGRWPEADAMDRARKEFEQLLPKGMETEGKFFFNILDETAKTVGSLWFGKAQRGGCEIGFVLDIVILKEHRRRGHAHRALQALEIEASRMGLAGMALHVFGHNSDALALYSKLGYEPTNINMYKPLAPVQCGEISPSLEVCP